MRSLNLSTITRSSILSALLCALNASQAADFSDILSTEEARKEFFDAYRDIESLWEILSPSAELRDNQKDEDSLPPYPVLDGILERLVEGDQSVAEVVAAGFDRATVKKVESLLYGAEWKRFQSAPGVRLTKKAFWLDRRYPIVNRWRDDE